MTGHQEPPQRFTSIFAPYGPQSTNEATFTREAAEHQLRQLTDQPERYVLVHEGMRYHLKTAWIEDNREEPGAGRVMVEYEADGVATWADMSGRQRDIFIAEKIFGQKASHWGNGLIVALDEDLSIGGALPEYSTSMDAAWKVVEKMKMPDSDPGWEGNQSLFADFCSYLERNGSSIFDVLWNLTPEAICLASLRAIGVEVE